MVFVVERYLPGLLRSDLLHGLSRFERIRPEDEDSGCATARPSCGITLLRRAGVACLLALTVLAPTATAYEVPVRLTQVARVYSLGVGEIRCPSGSEWDADFASSFSWAYTNVRQDYAVLGPIVCEGALAVGTTDVPAWQQAFGVLVLAHEAFHLRHWRYRRDEGKVECQALVHFRDAARELGASASDAEALYPYALALHGYKTRLFPQYRDPACVVPPWSPPIDDA